MFTVKILIKNDIIRAYMNVPMYIHRYWCTYICVYICTYIWTIGTYVPMIVPNMPILFAFCFFYLKPCLLSNIVSITSFWTIGFQLHSSENVLTKRHKFKHRPYESWASLSQKIFATCVTYRLLAASNKFLFECYNVSTVIMVVTLMRLYQIECENLSYHFH